MIRNHILVFIIDDDQSMLEIIQSFIAAKFPQIRLMVFKDGETALQNMEAGPQAVIIDYYLDRENEGIQNGLEILLKLKKINPALPVIMLSGQHSPEVAADIVKAGAFAYIVKNESSFERLELVLRNLTNHVILNKRIITQRLIIMALGLTVLFFLIYLGSRMLG